MLTNPQSLWIMVLATLYTAINVLFFLYLFSPDCSQSVAPVCSLLYVLAVGLLPTEYQIFKICSRSHYCVPVVHYFYSTVSRNCTNKQPLFFTGTVMLVCDGIPHAIILFYISVSNELLLNHGK